MLHGGLVLSTYGFLLAGSSRGTTTPVRMSWLSLGHITSSPVLLNKKALPLAPQTHDDKDNTSSHACAHTQPVPDMVVIFFPLFLPSWSSPWEGRRAKAPVPASIMIICIFGTRSLCLSKSGFCHRLSSLGAPACPCQGAGEGKAILFLMKHTWTRSDLSRLKLCTPSVCLYLCWVLLLATCEFSPL